MSYLDKFKEIAEKTMESAQQLAETYQTSKNELKMTFEPRNSFSQSITVRKDCNNNFYIGSFSETSERYQFENLDFNGSKMSETTNTKSTIKATPSIRGLIGFPVSKVKTISHTTQKEKPGKATIYLRSVSTGNIKKIHTLLTSSEVSNALRFFDK